MPLRTLANSTRLGPEERVDRARRLPARQPRTSAAEQGRKLARAGDSSRPSLVAHRPAKRVTTTA
eukprot:3744271-Rhodomonas_salina.2